MRYRSQNVTETQHISAELAATILNQHPGHHATVIALEGELGAGKTTFAQSFAKALGIQEKVKSPTFLLMKTYPLTSANYRMLCHIDCYRVNDYRELLPLGIEQIMADPSVIVLIEWPERIARIVPPEHLTIHIDHVSKTERTITVT